MEKSLYDEKKSVADKSSGIMQATINVISCLFNGGTSVLRRPPYLKAYRPRLRRFPPNTFEIITYWPIGLT